MLWSISSPLYIISSSPRRTGSPANSPSPASGTVDLPTRTRLNSSLRMAWLLQFFLGSSPKQLLQTSGSHSELLLKQMHLLLRQSSFLQPQPRLRMGQAYPHRHWGRQKPRYRQAQVSHWGSSAGSPRK